MAGTLNFSVTPPPQQATAVAIQGSPSDTNLGTFNGSQTIPAATAGSTASSASFSVSVTDSKALPSSLTDFYNPLSITWSVAQGDGAVTVATSANPVYVTLTTPGAVPGAGAQMLTYIKLAVGNGGAQTAAAAFQNTWNQFAGPANVKAWDGRALSYYPAGTGFSGCVTTQQQSSSATVQGRAKRFRCSWRAPWQ